MHHLVKALRDLSRSRKRPLRHGLHAVLSILTLGLWLPVWIGLIIKRRIRDKQPPELAGKGQAGMDRVEDLDLTPEIRRKIQR